MIFRFFAEDEQQEQAALAARTGVSRIRRCWLLDEDLGEHRQPVRAKTGVVRLRRCWLFEDPEGGLAGVASSEPPMDTVGSSSGFSDDGRRFVRREEKKRPRSRALEMALALSEAEELI